MWGEQCASDPVGGRDYPRRLHEFNEWFPSQEDCAGYLRRLRWPDGTRSPAGKSGATPIRRGYESEGDTALN
jgi:hypothetical protein